MLESLEIPKVIQKGVHELETKNTKNLKETIGTSLGVGVGWGLPMVDGEGMGKVPTGVTGWEYRGEEPVG